jgi:pilus assembly protein CpaC
MQCRGNRPTMRGLARALSFSAVAALMFNQTLTPVIAGD